MNNRIESINNPYIKFLNKLNTKKSIINEKRFLLEGKNIIDEAVKNGFVTKVLVTDQNSRLFPNVETIIVTPEIIKKLSSNKSNKGVVAVAEYKPLNLDVKELDKIIILENINNPGNLGSIIRTAKAFGFKGIILLGESVFPYNDKVIRSSQGEVLNMSILETNNYDILKKFNIYHFVIDNYSKSISELEFKKPFALVFGNEANGITEKLLKEMKGEHVSIEIEKTNSLNLSNAAAIAMFKTR